MFKYSILPEELKNSILRAVALKDVPQLFKTNKRFQKKFLQNGPFRRKVESLFIIPIDIDRNEFPDQKPSLFVCLNGDIEFRVTDTTVKLIIDLNTDEIPMNSSPSTFWSLLNQMTSLERLELQLRTRFNCLSKYIENGTFLPKLTALSRFRFDTSTELAEALFAVFRVKVDDYFQVNFNRYDEPDGSIARVLREILSKTTIKNCKILSWSDLAVSWEQISIPDSKLLIIREKNEERFRSAVNEMITRKHGKEKESIIMLTYSLYWSEEVPGSEFSTVKALVEEIPEMEGISEESEAAHFLENLLNKHKDQLYVAENIALGEQKAYFKKNVSEYQEAIYLLAFEQDNELIFVIKYRSKNL